VGFWVEEENGEGSRFAGTMGEEGVGYVHLVGRGGIQHAILGTQYSTHIVLETRYSGRYFGNAGLTFAQ
jgi:hypothetical protein